MFISRQKGMHIHTFNEKFTLVFYFWLLNFQIKMGQRERENKLNDFSHIKIYLFI